MPRLSVLYGSLTEPMTRYCGIPKEIRYFLEPPALGARIHTDRVKKCKRQLAHKHQEAEGLKTR